MTKFVPRAEIVDWIAIEAPEATASIAITQATPMTIASIVRKERILFRRMPLRPILDPVPRGRHRRDRSRGGGVRGDLELRRLADRNWSRLRRSRVRVRGSGEDLLRVLSGPDSLTPGPHRGAQIRVRTSFRPWWCSTI